MKSQKTTDLTVDIDKKTSVDSVSAIPVQITRYHTTSCYPHLLFEYEAELENNKKVYINLSIDFDAEKKGIPISYQEDMEYWIYSTPLDNVIDESTNISLDNEVLKKLLKEGLELWNGSLSWNENWTTAVKNRRA